MTVQELKKLYYLKKLIERDTLRLEELEAKLQSSGARMDGMPRGTSHENMMEKLIPFIADLRDQITAWRIEYIQEYKAIEEYIHSVDDYLMRSILSYRFVDLRTWDQVAAKIGGGNTAESVRKACYRFLRKSEKVQSNARSKKQTQEKKP